VQLAQFVRVMVEPVSRDARVSRGLTQAELSGLTGIPQADISRIERGGGNPTESTMQRLAHALNGRLQLVTA
jgi:transcriptional regulator with XRE-family HTH domain